MTGDAASRRASDAAPAFAATRRTLFGAAGAVLATPTLAQTARPTAIIVPLAAGAPPDLVARLLADGLARRTGTPHVVENRVGASGRIGTGAAARAMPDGGTLLLTTNALVLNVPMFRSIPYDPVADFAPVALLATSAFCLLLHPSGGATVAEFVARAKARPDALNYGSPGIGTPHHLAMELLRQRTGVELTHVPHRAFTGAANDLLSGQVAALFSTVGAARALAEDGRVRVAAMADPERHPSLPDVPTFAEAGFPGIEVNVWYGLFAPAGTPPATIARLNAAANEVLAAPEVRTAMAAQGMTPAPSPPDRLRDLVAADLARWTTVVRTAGIQPE